MKVVVAQTLDELMKVMVIRGIVFMGEQKHRYQMEFDANELVNRTHLLAMDEKEPVGTMRIMKDGKEAKFERLAVLPEYRGKGTAEDIIQANPDLQAFFCINDPSSLGAVAAIQAANLKGQIGVYSIDASPDGKEALLDGSFTAVACQVPLGIAETGVESAVTVLEGGTVEKEIWLDSHLVTKEEAEETAGEWQ